MSSEQQQERESLTDEQMEVSSAPMPRSRDRAQRASKETQSLGPTPLIVAVESGNVDVVRALIEAGALLDETIALGFSALHIASSLPDRGEITAALASAGANVNLAAEEGVTPLMAAAQHGHTESLSALLAAGADPNQPGEELCTPLHVRIQPALERFPSHFCRCLACACRLTPTARAPSARSWWRSRVTHTWWACCARRAPIRPR